MYKALCATLLSSLANAGVPIVEWNENTIPSDEMKDFEFSVINFYDNSDLSKEINKVYEAAHKKFTDLQDAGQIVGREVGWFNVNIEEYPHLKYEEIDKPNQVITGHRLKRNLNFVSIEGELEEEASQMAAIVFDMSGNWIERIECDEIMKDDEQGRYTAGLELVYFGSLESLADPDGDMRFLKHASMIDRYEFFQEKPHFYVVPEPECAIKHDLDPEKQNILLWINKQLEPNRLTGDPKNEEVGPLNMMQTMKFIQQSIVSSIPRWSERAHTLLFDFQMNGIVYIIDEIPNNDPRELMNDWKALTFNAIVDYTRQYETGMIPVMSTYEANNLGGIMQLSELLNVNKEDLPMFYTIHSRTGQSVAYPYTLEDPLDVSPELILLWSRRTVLYLEIESFDSIIKQIDEKEDITDEEKAEYKEEVEKVVGQAKEELDVVIKKFDEVLALVAENKAEFLKQEAEEKEKAAQGSTQDETTKEQEQEEHIEL